MTAQGILVLQQGLSTTAPECQRFRPVHLRTAFGRNGRPFFFGEYRFGIAMESQNLGRSWLVYQEDGRVRRGLCPTNYRGSD